MRAPYLAIIPALLLMVTEAGATQCVNPGGTGGCHASIQAAVNAAVDGETVHIHAGTYTEFTLIPAGGNGPGRILDIEGEGPGVTIIDGAVEMRQQSRVRIRDLTVINEPVNVWFGSAVGIDGCDVRSIEVSDATVTVTDTIVSGGRLRVASGSQAFVSNSTISGSSGDGIVLVYAPGRRSELHLSSSIVENNGEAGIKLYSGRSTIVDTTIRGNGVGLNLDFNSRLTIERSTVSGNDTAGILVRTGTLRLLNSTVSGNADHGMLVDPHGRVRISSSTIAANTAVATGGGIFVEAGGIVTAVNTILADNVAPAGVECSGRVRSRGFNLIEMDEPAACDISGSSGGNVVGVDPMLGPLAANGGPTETHALLAGSPAIDAGNPALLSGRGRACPRFDQRFVDREPTLPCDIGAYEAP